MIWEIGTIAKVFFLPPWLWGWLVLFGLMMFRRRPKVARRALAVGFFLSYASATPLVADTLLQLVTSGASDTGRDLRAQAIVVLAGGRNVKVDSQGRVVGASLTSTTAERVLEGIRVARLTELPILVSGGAPDGRDPAEGVVMRDVMRRDLVFPPKWVEGVSRNTVESARLTSKMLRAEQIDSIMLVTHQYHMRRARFLFEAAGMRVMAVPVQSPSPPARNGFGLLRWVLPDAAAWTLTLQASNEVGGIVYAWLVTQLAAAPTPSAAVGN